MDVEDGHWVCAAESSLSRPCCGRVYLLMDPAGNPFLWSKSLIDFSSWTWLTPEEKSFTDRHIKVLTTALLCAARWWELKAKYWSMCVWPSGTHLYWEYHPSPWSWAHQEKVVALQIPSQQWTECSGQCCWGACGRAPPSHGECVACVIHIPLPKLVRGVKGCQSPALNARNGLRSMLEMGWNPFRHFVQNALDFFGMKMVTSLKQVLLVDTLQCPCWGVPYQGSCGCGGLPWVAGL